MVNLLFGASGSLGSSLIKTILKKYTKLHFLNISRSRPLGPKNRWLKHNLNNKAFKFKDRNIKYCIFLASPEYLKKNMSYKKFSQEYIWIKKIVKSIKIDTLIYVSSPTIYIKQHYVGANKFKIEKFLIKNKNKFKSLQIWRPYNLVNIDYLKYSDHFHSLLYKIMFIHKKTAHNFNGNKYDARGYSDIDDFSKVLLKNAFLNKSFVKDYGNLNIITIDEIIKIYKKYYYAKFKKIFNPTFKSKKMNINTVKRKSGNVYFKQSSESIIKKYLLKRLYEKK